VLNFLPSLQPSRRRGQFAVAISLVVLAVPLAQAKVIFVNQGSPADPPDGQSWATAFPSVQQGIDDAAEGDEVWVAAATYVGQVQLTPGVALYGGFTGTETQLDQRNWTNNLTVLDGNRTNTVVIVLPGATNTTRIDGFTIQNCVTTLRPGGGISLTNASPVIANNVIRSNRAFSGGGIYCQRSFAVIARNTISDNRAESGGGVCSEQSALQVIGNTITRNLASDLFGSVGLGGGIRCRQSHPANPNVPFLITSNSIVANSAVACGGGVLCDVGAGGVISQNLIAHNEAQTGGGGGLEIAGGDVTVEHNLILGNGAVGTGGIHAGWGGGIGVPSPSTATILNNLLMANSAIDGGGIYNRSDNVRIANNSILGNVGVMGSSGVTDAFDAEIVNNLIAFGYSAVGGVRAGSVFSNNCLYANAVRNYNGTDRTGTAGNISVDPRLTGDVVRGEFHLAPDSPCRDAGLSGIVPGEDALDFDGQLRIQDSAVDIGADESDGAITRLVPRIVRVSPAGDDRNDGTSWALAKRTVQAGIDAAALGGGDVWVQAATYPERIALRTLTYLYGGFLGIEINRDERDWRTNPTFLDADQAGPVVTATNVTSFSAIDGFVIQNGRGGIACQTASPAILNNLIRWNTASNLAGGGGICLIRSHSMVSGNTIVSNSCIGSGGGIFAKPGQQLTFTPRPQILNNFIASNQAVVYRTGGRGGGIYCEGSPLIANNTLLGNSVTPTNTPSARGAGGGIEAQSSTASIVNNLVAFGTSGIKGTSSTLELLNNCVFGNRFFDYSGIPNPTGTDGNLSTDPLLVATNDFHLGTNSPCLDAGDDFSAHPDWRDLDGEPRMMGAHVDIGADEATQPGVWQRPATPADLIQLSVTNAGGIAYGTFEVTLPDSCYQLLSVGPVARAGTDFSRDFRILRQTGGICLPMATSLRTNFLLGRLLPGDYTFTSLSWGEPAERTPFAWVQEGFTLVSPAVQGSGQMRFTALGVPDVQYVVEASTNLTGWSALATNLGGSFDFEDADATNWPQRFYRVQIGP